MAKKKYYWSTEQDAILRRLYDGKIKGRVAEIAQTFHRPAWEIKKRAAHLGLCHPVERKDWTESEWRFLFNHAGDKSTGWIARKLGRSETSVVLKFKREKLSARVKAGYTMRDLEECFGVDHHTIERWITTGKLQARRRKTGRANIQGDPYCLNDEAILSFIKNHPMTFHGS